jgi:hypothetical protein
MAKLIFRKKVITTKIADNKTIGKEAKTIRLNKEMTLRSVAEKIGITTQYYWMLESGRAKWSAELVADFNDAILTQK